MRLSLRLASVFLGLSMVLTIPAWAADISNSAWSETDGSNNQVAPNGWKSGVMLPSQVEPTARAMMGAIKRFYNHLNGTVTSGGTANAQTLTYSVAPGALVAGDTFTFQVGSTNTGATTLNVNSLGATAVQNGGSALIGGELTSGKYVSVIYDGTNFQLAVQPPSAVAIVGGTATGLTSSGATPGLGSTDGLAAFTQTGAAAINPRPTTRLSTDVGGAYNYLQQAAMVYSITGKGEPALFGASRTSDTPSPQTCCAMGVAGLTVNDNTSNPAGSWAIYGVGARFAGTGNLTTMELDAWNDGTTIALNPYSGVNTGASLVAALLAGGEPVVSGPTTPGNDLSTILLISSNGSTAQHGIVFGSNLFNASFCTTNCPAIDMAYGQEIRWAETSGDVAQSFVRGNNSTTTSPNGIVMNQFGTLFENGSGGIEAAVSYTASPAGYVSIGTNGNDAFIGVGSGNGNTNKNLGISAQGSGAVQILVSPFQLPAVTTGTPAASLCLDASNNVVKKTTAGSCI